LIAEAGHPASNRRRVLIAIAGAGVLAYLAAAALTDAGRLAAALTALGWSGTAAVLAASLLNYGLRFQRWSIYVARLGHAVPRGRHLLVYLCGFAFTVSPGKAGEAVRALYLREHGVPYAASIAALFVERLLDLVAIALLAGLFVLHDPSWWPALAAALAATVALIVFVGRPAVATTLARIGDGRPGRVGQALGGLASLLRASRTLLAPRLLGGGLLFGLAAWGVEGLGLYWICAGLGLTLDVITATGVYGLSVLAGGAAFFMPGGLGGMEVAMPALLVTQGATLATGVIAMLLCRLATLWFAVVLGLVAATWLETRSRTVPVPSAP
jgi:uncharacterized membrane protein YbhN (UPF0104 family)